MSLTFFNAEKYKSKRGPKSQVRKHIDKIINMPKDKAVTISGKPTKLKSLKSILYNEHPGQFRIYDNENKITVKWKQ